MHETHVARRRAPRFACDIREVGEPVVDHPGLGLDAEVVDRELTE